MKVAAISLLVLLITAVSGQSIAGEKLVVSAEGYGDHWSLIVHEGQLECIDKAVLFHAAERTYSVNGEAMRRYLGVLPEIRDIPLPDQNSTDSEARISPYQDFLE
jgi:hypothetical protein